MSILQDFLKQVLDFALSGTGDVGVAASAHLRLQLLLSATQTLAPASGASSTPASTPSPAAAAGTASAATGSGGAGTGGTTAAVTAATDVAPVAAAPADPARAITMLGAVLASLGRLLA
ncbi:MAG: hypothetical protein KGL25_12790 [Gammaproteobacteria bacterium]|nr:hypothetical protein [Gammaproteobacteria bacterium]